MHLLYEYHLGQSYVLGRQNGQNAWQGTVTPKPQLDLFSNKHLKGDLKLCFSHAAVFLYFFERIIKK